MKRVIIFLLIIFNNNLFSQVAVAANHTSAFLPQGLSLPLLNGYGNSAIHNDVTNIGSLNPAALENFNNIMFGFSYQYETKIDESWIADIGSKRINNWIPQSVGLVFPYKDVRFAISMHQKYNRSLLFGPIEITTAEKPDGIGEFIELEYETFIYNYSFSTSYTYKNFLYNSELSFGFRIGLNNLNEYSDLYKSWIDASVYATDISFGAIYSTPKIDNHYFKIGIFYQKKLELNYQLEVFN
ncbi:MAG: hypothetical protein PF445_01840 [Melioribacteraceae bacterium]|nr:hypothetical protein [Melioribacteraceae bacterium]